VSSPEVRYAPSGDLSIAYLVHGDGPMDIVYVPGFISNLDLIWELPFYRHIIERLGSFGRVITFDKRGTGLSDRTLGHGSISERMDDIRAVMDAAGSSEAALIGVSEGGPLSIAFAASSPARVRALVLWGTFALCTAQDDYPIGMPREVLERNIEAAAAQWGRGETLRFFVADIPRDPETDRMLARYERGSATPALVAEILRQNIALDVRSALPAISAPTLVLHRTGDRIVPLRLGRYVADHIEGARWCELPGDFHVNGSPTGERDALDEIETFLTGERRSAPSDRVLATVLFTDIVDSTAKAAELGDRRWREVLDAHDTVVRRELARAGGREVNTTGDGFLAVFDAPARAVRSAQAMVGATRAFGVEIRAGLHTGEVEVRGDDVAGMAVNIGARVASRAGAGEVLVTSTVRDLVVGSDLAFAECGRYELKGVPGEWQLLAVAG
jgi:class 3 adenylate cyclase/pimeloyl-ACP methyl ester carboxylesterase